VSDDSLARLAGALLLGVHRLRDLFQIHLPMIAKRFSNSAFLIR
jgi:hypothetical protein